MREDDRHHLWISKDRITRQPVGHGTGGEPAFARTDYGKHARSLQRQIDGLRDVVSAKLDATLSRQYIVQVAVPKAVPIRKHKVRLEQVGIEFIGYSPSEQNVAIAKITKPGFDELADRVYRYATTPKHVGRSNLSVIDQIGDVPLESKVDSELRQMHGDLPCVVALYNDISNSEKQEVLHSLFQLLKERGIADLQIHNLLSGAATLVATLPENIIEEVGTGYLTVKSIRRNNTAVITKTVLGQPVPEGINVLEPETKAVVAVVDSGICDGESLMSPLVVDRYAVLPAGCVGKELAHGTLVASRTVFGEALENVAPNGKLSPACRIVDICVFGIDETGKVRGLRESDLIKALDKHVPALAQRVRVFNLSLGFDSAVAPNAFSLLASEIDFLSRTFDVLFVIAAGNISDPQGDHPSHFLHQTARIQPPAESLLALSVGSLAKYAVPGSMSMPNEVSCFSCIGPGSDGGIKPEIVAHGGNLLNGWIESARVGVCGLDSSGSRLAYSVGTSFAAPIVSGMAARLFGSLPDCSVNLVKALLCHFAAPVSSPSVDGLNGRTFYGFGEPSLPATLAPGPNAATYLFVGKATPDSYQFVPFHIPKTVASSGGNEKNLRVRMTLVFNPPTNQDNQVEYSKCRMSIALFKAANGGYVPVQGGDESHVLPWATIVHFDRAFSRSYATGEWQARVRLMTRGGLPENFEQEYALVIEVLDPTGGTDVFRDVIDEFPAVYGIVVESKAA